MKKTKIFSVCIFRSEGCQSRDLVRETSNANKYIVNFDNLAIVGYDRFGHTYLLDNFGNIKNATDKHFSFRDLVADGRTANEAFERFEQVIRQTINNKPSAGLFNDFFPWNIY